MDRLRDAAAERSSRSRGASRCKLEEREGPWGKFMAKTARGLAPHPAADRAREEVEHPGLGVSQEDARRGQGEDRQLMRANLPRSPMLLMLRCERREPRSTHTASAAPHHRACFRLSLRSSHLSMRGMGDSRSWRWTFTPSGTGSGGSTRRPASSSRSSTTRSTARASSTGFLTSVRLMGVCLVASVVIGVVGAWMQGSRLRRAAADRRRATSSSSATRRRWCSSISSTSRSAPTCA